MILVGVGFVIVFVVNLIFFGIVKVEVFMILVIVVIIIVG